MKTVSVKVSEEQARRIDEYIRRMGYASKSEFIRDAIRRMTGPELSEKTKKEITEARKQIKRGKTIPLEKVEKKVREN